MALTLTLAGRAIAQVDDKLTGASLDKNLQIYINGQTTTYDGTEPLDLPVSNFVMTLSYPYLLNKLEFLNHALDDYESPHPVKPFLMKMFRYLLNKLQEDIGESSVTFESTQICREYLQFFAGVRESFKLPPKPFKYQELEYYDALTQYQEPSKPVDKHTMDELLLMCQQFYLQCYDRLQREERENTSANHQEGSSNDAPANLGDGGNTVGSHEAITKGASSADSSALPSSSSADNKAAPLRMKRSMDARKPEPSVSSQEPGPSGVNPAPSDDDKQLQRQLSEGESGPAEHEDDKRSHNPPQNKIDEDSAADWDEYFNSLMHRLSTSSEDGEPSNEPVKRLSMWKRFRKSLRKHSCI
ncbi:hypothetical protein BBBOND_0311160 [Babesia bigemina]|uniref:Uncharacterized protein n=1 Tax=Babesia bigemina TaxID=5866 RepID=A0A061D9J6_BABBI|nr:hypothetical protein BBBOND_0311160 [Babesia bigemina]CDR97213.1 hypothetical protein BBBOND_0311160 [Babesia bigemina]|eukprot:XP_012769399.1 hypothetical protein BBBOND_0311160 [Babesia bigemina]